MKIEEFIKEVMHQANLSSRQEAQDAVRATLETLSEHLTPGEVENFSSQLPAELAIYMNQPLIGGIAEGFSLDEFVERVSQREGVGIADAAHHAHVVASLLGQVVTLGLLDHLIAQLPTDIAQLFITQDSEKDAKGQTGQQKAGMTTDPETSGDKGYAKRIEEKTSKH